MGLGKTIDPAIKMKFAMSSVISDGIDVVAAVAENFGDYKKDQLLAAAELAYVLAALEDNHPHGRKMLLANSRLLLKLAGGKELKIQKPVPMERVQELIAKLKK